MISVRKLTVYLVALALMPILSACSKKNPELETDYATKKASAETLMGQINSAVNTMKDDQTKWGAALDEASKKQGADTAKLNALRNNMKTHMDNANAIMALEDSVKTYMNATPDNADAFKNADDRLGTNFNDLSDKWKSFQDAHSKLGKDITDATVAAAGAPMKDETKASDEIKKPTAKPHTEAKASEPAKSPEKSHGHGVPANPMK